MHPCETFFIPARLSVFRRDFLHSGETFFIPARLSADPDESRTFIGDSGDPDDLRDPGDPVIRSFECHFLNGKKIHADRRQGDRREDFERASDRGPREFSRSSEEPRAVDAW